MEITTRSLFINIHWKKDYSNITWPWQVAISKGYYDYGNKLIRPLIERLQKLYVRNFRVESASNSHTENVEHLLIILQKRKMIWNIEVEEEDFD